MATVTSLGSGSGLQLETLVSKLMTAESVSLKTIQKKQASYETKVSAMGSLRSALASLQTAAKGMTPDTIQTARDKFAAYTATVANTTVASATAASGAVAGTHSLEVSKLAQGQRLTSAATNSSNISSTGGTLTLNFGSMNSTTGLFEADSARSFTFNVGANGTLASLRDAINKSDAKVTATIVNGTDGAHLVLTGPEGANNVMQFSSSVTGATADIPGFNFDPNPSGTKDMTQNLAAQDAAFVLNGIAATSHSNTVTGALDGVTLELTGTNVGAATTLKITEDLSTNVTKALESFVAAYNSAYSTMSTLGAYDPETKIAGKLQGNNALRYAMTQIRQAAVGATSGTSGSPYQTLSNIGVTINSSGKLEINSTKLTAAIKADSTTVTNLISNVGNAFDASITKMSSTNGTLTIATNGLNTTVKDLEKQQTKMQDRLDAIEKRYRAQFTALDTLVSSLNKTGDYLTSYISSLNSSNK